MEWMLNPDESSVERAAVRVTLSAILGNLEMIRVTNGGQKYTVAKWWEGKGDWTWSD
jgi:hypothetical protein